MKLAFDAAFNAGDGTKPIVFEHLAVARGILGDLSGAEELISRLQDSDKVDPLWDLTMWLGARGERRKRFRPLRANPGRFQKHMHC
jgi:hypothetical protein